MSDVQRRASKTRFSWMRSKEKVPVPQPIKLVKGGPRRMPVSAPRKVLGPSTSLDSLNTEDSLLKVNGSASAPTTPVEIDPKPWVVGKPEEAQKDWSDEHPPAWARKSGEWNDTPLPLQPRFSIYESKGPAWYINHHLKPPPSAMPRTSFPPSAFSSNPMQGQGSVPASRPSPSPLRAYTDIVDSLDVSDPHGQRWHHTSPYELGRKNSSRPRSSVVGPGVGTYAGPIEGSEVLDQSPTGSSSSTTSSPSSTGRLHPRSRNSSSTKLAPSPLSQSTSAYDIGQSSRDLTRLPQPAIINLDDDPPQIPSAPEVPVSGPSPSPAPADHPLARSRSASPLKPTSPSAHSPATSKSAPPELNKRNTRETPRRTTGHLFGLFGSSPEASTRLPRRRSASATTHRDTLTRKRSRRSSQVGPRPISPSTVAPNIISSPTVLKTQTPRSSPSPNPAARIQAEERRDKRGSMFGRLLKKFSIVRKPGITWEDTAVRPGKIPETTVPDRVREVLVPNVYPELAQPTPSPSAAFAPTFVDAADSALPDVRDLSLSTDLPHHLPTPKISSPLVILPPMSPSPEPHALMALTITNPDIESPTTPSPPRRTIPLADVDEPPPLVAPSPVRHSPPFEDPRSSSDEHKFSSSEDYTPRQRDHAPQPSPDRTPTRGSEHTSRPPVPSKSGPQSEDLRERDGTREQRDHRRHTPHRPRDRSRDRDHRHERSRDRDGDRHHDRPRDRDRDRSRDRSRDRGPHRESSSSLEGRAYEAKRREGEDRHRRRPTSESPTKGPSSSSYSALRDSSQGIQSPTPSTVPLVLRERRSRRESGGDQSGSSSSRRPHERPSLASLPSGQGVSSSSQSGHSSSTQSVPKSGQPSPSARRKQPSMETISALGKEWEIVADTPSRHRSRSRDHRRGSLDKTDPALSAVALENAWTGPQSRPRMLKGRRSASADSITSSSRKPPTPPPKPQSAQSPRPPTTGPQLPRRSQTPPSRRSSPSPSLSPSKVVISAPVAIQRTPSRHDSSSRTDARSPRQSPTKPDGRVLKSGRPISAVASTQRPRHKPSASTEDLGSARDAKVAWEHERMRKGQSWSVPESSPEEEERQLQLRLAVIRGTQAGHGRPPTSQSAGSGGTDGGTSITRAGSSHTSFSLQAPLMLTSRNQQGSTPELTVPVAGSNGYYGQYSPSNQGHVSATPYHLGGIMHSQSYSHSQSRFGYEAAPFPVPSAPHPHLIHSSSLPAGYPSSSSLPDLSLSTYPPQPNVGSTYVQFSTRAPYPIAPYPYDAPTSPWSQYPSPP